MTTLSTQAVIELTVGTTDDAHDTIKVEDLIALIKNTPIVRKYQSQVVNALEPNAPWLNDQTMTINITVDINPVI